MEEAEQDKSELPTHHKLQQARKKGSVARGMDLGFLTALAAFAGYMWFMGRSIGEQVSRASGAALVAAPTVLSSPNEILAVTGAVLVSALEPLTFLAATVFAVVLVFELVQTGVVFTGAPLKPDFSRLNPGKGLKRVFSFQMLIQTGKSVLKLVLYVAVSWLVVQGAITVAAATVTDARSLSEAMRAGGLKLLALFLLVAVAVAVLDQLISRRDYLKKMRMSRREVRREHRDREGEPRLKQKRKQLHAEFAKARQSLRGLKGADVLVTNPTHYAVALKYDARTMSAPQVVSKGANQFAQRLKRAAFLHGVAIVEDRLLARALYHGVDLRADVPETLFAQVARLYRAIGPSRQEAHVVA